MTDIKQQPGRFYIGEAENPIAEITFDEEQENLSVDHTFVDEAHREQGLGAKLVEKVADYARETNKKIIPFCPFAEEILSSNSKYEDVWTSPM